MVLGLGSRQIVLLQDAVSVTHYCVNMTVQQREVFWKIHFCIAAPKCNHTSVICPSSTVTVVLNYLRWMQKWNNNSVLCRGLFTHLDIILKTSVSCPVNDQWSTIEQVVTLIRSEYWNFSHWYFLNKSEQRRKIVKVHLNILIWEKWCN